MILQCDEGSILAGILHADVPGDDKDTEKIVGIVCQEISLR